MGAEIPISLVVSLVAGVASAIFTLEKKFDELKTNDQELYRQVDQRVDTIELRLAKEYVDKDDLSVILTRLDDRIDRMDYKLDQLLIGYNKNAPKV